MCNVLIFYLFYNSYNTFINIIILMLHDVTIYYMEINWGTEI